MDKVVNRVSKGCHHCPALRKTSTARIVTVVLLSTECCWCIIFCLYRQTFQTTDPGIARVCYLTHSYNSSRKRTPWHVTRSPNPSVCPNETVRLTHSGHKNGSSTRIQSSCRRWYSETAQDFMRNRSCKEPQQESCCRKSCTRSGQWAPPSWSISWPSFACYACGSHSQPQLAYSNARFIS
jgi:hypothetical protein